MKQILQSLKTGATEVAEVPCPTARRGQLLIRTSRTLVSVGTERMLVEFGKAGWIEKARQQPDKVRMVLDKIKTDGLMPTLEAVFNKLDQPLPLGYCNVGSVMQAGGGVSGFEVGDRVVSNGKILEVTKQITDPKAYKNTFSNTVYMERRPEVDVQEYYCDDNERTKDEGH